uniref:NADH dehydrogenase subunit 3 n=1 Tax=Phyllidia elegans TaxID=71379 RepID=UPI0020281F9A|nr:NADH dehydrogenase subunit 3 [Phyllidia elegans]UPP55828.1 NADH dehydrogenase subunit 3 [Phyllidia elegans]
MLFLHINFIIILSFVLVVIYLMTNYISMIDSSEKLTSFECGFDPLSKMRSPFSTRFFLLVVLFLIFDVEIALLFPVLSMLVSNFSFLMMSSLFLFLLILIFGMFHEWNEGALDWFSN